jgi:hypothetical protein
MDTFILYDLMLDSNSPLNLGLVYLQFEAGKRVDISSIISRHFAMI